MKECKYCGSTYADSLSACPNCGGSKIVTAEEKVAEEKLYVKEVQNQERSVTVPAETEKKRIPKFVIALGVVSVIIAIIIAISAGGGAGTSGSGNNPGNQTPQVDAAFDAGQKYYNTGNYEAAIRELSDVSVDSKHYEDAQTMLADAVEKYRTATLDRASTYTNNGEYETALSLLVEAQSVLPNDSTLKTAYDSAYTAYVDSVIAKADSYTQAADYETAIGILNTAKNKYPQDTRLETSYVTTCSAYKSLVCQTAINEADACAADGDYVNAIQILNAAVNKVGPDEAVTAKIRTYAELYKKDLLAAAKSAYHSDGYQAAITLLKNGQAILGTDQEITAQIEKYNNCKPISVAELNCVYTNAGGFSSWSVEESMMGEEYTDYSNLLYHSAGYIDYELLGNYKMISGSLIYNGSVTKVERTPVIKFYSDGTLLGTYQVTRNDRRVDFCLDISGVQYLRIEVEYMIAATYFGSFVDENFTMAGINDFYIYKDYIS